VGAHVGRGHHDRRPFLARRQRMVLQDHEGGHDLGDAGDGHRGVAVSGPQGADPRDGDRRLPGRRPRKRGRLSRERTLGGEGRLQPKARPRRVGPGDHPEGAEQDCRRRRDGDEKPDPPPAPASWWRWGAGDARYGGGSLMAPQTKRRSTTEVRRGWGRAAPRASRTGSHAAAARGGSAPGHARWPGRSAGP